MTWSGKYEREAGAVGGAGGGAGGQSAARSSQLYPGDPALFQLGPRAGQCCKPAVNSATYRASTYRPHAEPKRLGRKERSRYSRLVGVSRVCRVMLPYHIPGIRTAELYMMIRVLSVR